MKKFAELSILIAGILWGLAGLFVSGLSEMGFTSIQISSLRWIFSSAITLVAVLILKPGLLKIKLSDLGWFFCTGVLCILLSSTLYFVTMPLTTVAVANILMYTSPIWIMVFSIIIFKEKITVKKIITLFLAVAGCAFATGIIGSKAIRFTPLGIITGLLSGLFYGLYSIFGKYVLKKYSSITVTLYTMFFAGLGSFFMVDISTTAQMVIENSAVFRAVLLALVVTILPYTFYTIGLKYCKATKASILCCIEPMTSAIVGTLVLHQPFSPFQIVGVIMIISAGIILQIKKQK